MTTEKELSEYFAGFKQNLHARNYERAAGYLHLLYMNIGFHPSIISQVTFEPLQQREFVRFIDIYVREFPDDPVGYLLHMSYHFDKARLDIIREIWSDTCRNAVKGFHYQPGVAASIFDAERGMPYTSIGGMGLGKTLSSALSTLATQSLNATEPPDDSSVFDNSVTSPVVETGSGEPIGLDSVALNGTLRSFTIPTRYYFRYGNAPDDLSRASPSRNMPAGLHAMVRDGGANLFRRVACYASAVQFVGADAAADPPSNLAMKLEWPFGKDRNHLDGIGVIDLLLGWQNQAQARGQTEGLAEAQPKYPSLTFCGEETDLRDAQLRITYRSEDLDPKDFRPVAWLHGRTGTAAFPDEWDDLAAWAVTSDDAASTFVVDGEWHVAAFDLPAHSFDWTFCGSNIAEMGGGMARYTYAPIQEVQRDNKGGNVCIAFVHGHDLDTPEGAIDVAEMEMRYRSRSLLGPGQGAKLLLKPDRDRGDPGRLTNGVVGDIGQCYLVVMDNQDPVELVWKLRGLASIKAFKLHQCALAPAKDISVAVSKDGMDFEEVWTGSFDTVPTNIAEWGEFAQSGGLLRAIVLSEAHDAQFIRLRILSAQQGKVAGLDAFEVFGDGLAFIPSAEPFTLSEKIDDLGGGTTVYAQLVAENEDGVFEGGIVEIGRPKTDVPLILSALMTAHSSEEAVFAARTVAMGQPARLHIDIVADDGSRILVPDKSIGQWQVPRDVRVRIAGLKPGATYTVTCQADNASGASLPYSFSYKAGTA